jgi:AbrB family looped-hinge helix DNA binding protein
MNITNIANAPTATVTNKGQVTIPAEIRQHLGIRPKDQVHFDVDVDGAGRIMAAPSRVFAKLVTSLRDLRQPVRLSAADVAEGQLIRTAVLADTDPCHPICSC